MLHMNSSVCDRFDDWRPKEAGHNELGGTSVGLTTTTSTIPPTKERIMSNHPFHHLFLIYSAENLAAKM